jgi:hypothetical protein
MASPYQQQALRRKLIYIGLIVALFTVSGLFRVYVVEARADELALREQNLGEVQISTSAIQLSLTGSRGFVVCALWYWAQDAQKKNRWNELDLYCESLTHLQPHFIRPWLFQSWNLSYNVSVEADQVRDKYFYVARGVQLLGKGERMNHYNPELRFNIGFYQQHKIIQSDETNVHRCLYQMSCMPNEERDPARFWTEVNGHPAIDMVVFEEFCKKHPQFVRRLKERLRCNQPEDVVNFLKDNRRIPSLYEDQPNALGQTPLKENLGDRFPSLPPPIEVREREAVPPPGGVGIYNDDRTELSYESSIADDFDANAASRAWYVYAQEALPAPHPTMPGESAPIVDRTRQRNPKMTTNLFRNHPPRAQSYVAERLEDEGWYGPEGWLITGWFDGNKFRNGNESRVGTDRNWAEEAWAKAHEMWKLRGKASHQLLDPQELAEKTARAEDWQKRHGAKVGAPPAGDEPAADSPEHKDWEDARFLYEYEYSNRLTNFKFHYNRSLVEMEPERNGQALVEARRTMFEARQSVRQGRRDRAAELFESKTGLERLRVVFDRYPDYRSDSGNQEEFYELELRYIKLMQDKEGGTYKQRMAAGRLLGDGLIASPWPMALDLLLTDPSLTSKLPVPEFLPPEQMRVDDYVGNSTIQIVKTRHGLLKPTPPPPMGPGGSGTPPPGMQMAPLPVGGGLPQK